MKLHELKIEVKYGNDILYSNKDFELRKNDRDFQVGDLVVFYTPYLVKNTNKTKYRMENKYFKITYVLKNCEKYGLKKGYCIFGITEVIVRDKDSDTISYPINNGFYTMNCGGGR